MGMDTLHGRAKLRVIGSSELLVLRMPLSQVRLAYMKALPTDAEIAECGAAHVGAFFTL